MQAPQALASRSKRYMSRATTLALVLLVVSACSPVVQTTRLGPAYPSGPPASDILVFSVRTPECPFEEFALITAENEPALKFIGVTEPLDALQNQARRVGGHAIIGLAQLPQAKGFRGGPRGTVIRFVQDDCQR